MTCDSWLLQLVASLKEVCNHANSYTCRSSRPPLLFSWLLHQVVQLADHWSLGILRVFFTMALGSPITNCVFIIHTIDINGYLAHYTSILPFYILKLVRPFKEKIQVKHMPIILLCQPDKHFQRFFLLIFMGNTKKLLNHIMCWYTHFWPVNKKI